MNCQQAKPLLEPYADGELEAAAIRELDQHLKTCPVCAGAWRNVQSLKTAVKQDAVYFSAPAELRKRIRAELPSPVSNPTPSLAWSWNWLTTLMSGAAAVCLALLLTIAVNRTSSEPSLAREVVSSHVRSLMVNHSLDVASSDQHTVKPWFDGKLDFAPPVVDLAAQEFPLIGGRLDYLDGKTVAALIFQRHKHVINLFIWPTKTADTKPDRSAPLLGYHLVHWTQAGMNLWAVSDLNETELLQFAEAFSATSRRAVIK